MWRVCFLISGVIKYKNGNVYKGELSYGNMHGEGRLEFQDGVIYEGEFQYNFITGKVQLTAYKTF